MSNYDLNNEEIMATRDGFGKALVELGEKNEKIVALAASVGDSTRAYKFKEKFPERYVEAGIAEQNMIGMATGLAMAGKIPFASSFATFLPGRSYDQIRQSVCYSNKNVKLVSTHSGISVGEDGATHQMMEDIAMMRATPNLTVIVPADARETMQATKAIAEMEGPVYMRLGRIKLPKYTKTDLEIGKANVMKEGKDLTIIAMGHMVYYSLKAAEKLEKEGMSVRVVNMHTIKPLDKEAILKAAEETKGIMTVEEHQIHGGLGGAVAEVLAQNKTPLKIHGMKDKFGESGDGKKLLEKHKLDEKGIAEEAKTFYNKLFK